MYEEFEKFVSHHYSQGDQRYRCLSALCWTSGLLILFLKVFFLCPGYRNNMEEKLNPGMDSLAYVEADGTNFISVEV